MQRPRQREIARSTDEHGPAPPGSRRRWGEGRRDRLPDLAAELVRLKGDVIFAAASAAAVAAQNATRTRRGATYVDEILKGGKPGDLPLEQPKLTITASVLGRADQVSE